MKRLSKFVKSHKKIVLICTVCLGIIVTTVSIGYNNKIKTTYHNKRILSENKNISESPKDEDKAKDIELLEEKIHDKTKAEAKFVEKKFTGRTNEIVELKEVPSNTSSVINKLDKHTIVEVLGVQQDWYKVKFKAKEGWINSQYLAEYTEKDKKKDENEKLKKDNKKDENKKSSKSKDIDKDKGKKTVSKQKPVNKNNKNQENQLTNVSNSKSNNKSNTNKNTKYKQGFKSSAFANSSQVILVTTDNMNTSYCNIKLYEKSGKDWNIKSNFSGRVGINGLAYMKDRKQSSNKTPAGIMNIISAFGTENNPGTKYSYTKVTNDMYWDLNSGSSTYNRLIHNNPGGDFEHLASYPVQYKYALVTDYNYCKTHNKGGAIFLHVSASGGTGGCISMSESNMKDLMIWIDPDKNPRLLVTPNNDLDKYWY